jgi:hypothetical protein
MTDTAHLHPPCPNCGGVVLSHRRLRAGRTDGRVRLSLRCSAPGCHWRARLRSLPAPVAGPDLRQAGPPGGLPPPRRSALRTSVLLSLLALCVASPLAVVSLLGLSAVAAQPQAFGVPPGAQDDGQAVPAGPAPLLAASAASGAAAAHGLQLRQGCRWGQPGRSPYRGSTRQALTAAGLPEDVVAQIVAQQQAGQKHGRLAIRRDGIRHSSDGRVFPAHGLALTYGMTLCRDASVNFPKGHVEMADLYEARDSNGRLHSVMVPDVCGNVSVLGAQGQRGVVGGMSASLARRAAALATLADALDPPLADGALAKDAAAGTGGSEAAGPGAVGGPSPAVAQPATGPTTAGTVQRAATVLSAGSVREGSVGPWTDAAPPVQVPGPLAAVGVLTSLLVPPQVAGGVVRQVGRVTAAAGRGVESLRGSLGATPSVLTASSVGAGARQVPEPGTLAMVLLALAALVLPRLRTGRRR